MAILPPQWKICKLQTTWKSLATYCHYAYK